MRAHLLILVAAFAVLTVGPGAILGRWGRQPGRGGRAPAPPPVRLARRVPARGDHARAGRPLFVAGFANGGIYAVDARTGAGRLPGPAADQRAQGGRTQAPARRRPPGRRRRRHRPRLHLRRRAPAPRWPTCRWPSRRRARPTPPSSTTSSSPAGRPTSPTRSGRSFTGWRSAAARRGAGAGRRRRDNPPGGDYEGVAGFNANGIEETPRGDLSSSTGQRQALPGRSRQPGVAPGRPGRRAGQRRRPGAAGTHPLRRGELQQPGGGGGALAAGSTGARSSKPSPTPASTSPPPPPS